MFLTEYSIKYTIIQIVEISTINKYPSDTYVVLTLFFISPGFSSSKLVCTSATQSLSHFPQGSTNVDFHYLLKVWFHFRKVVLWYGGQTLETGLFAHRFRVAMTIISHVNQWRRICRMIPLRGIA